METLKKKISKINKEQPLLSIEEIMRLMEEFYNKCNNASIMPSINFEFENNDYLQFYIETKPICGVYFPLWYIRLSYINNLTYENWETPSILVEDDIYDLIKEMIGCNVIDSKIKRISFT